VDIVSSGGDSSAYFSSDEVESPALPLGRLLGWIDRVRQTRTLAPPGSPYEEFSDPTPVQVLAVEANRIEPETPWAAPLTGTVRLYVQTLPSENAHSVAEHIRASLKEFASGDPFFSLHPPDWRPIVVPPLEGHEVPDTHPWVDSLRDAARRLTGRDPVSTAAPYPCDAQINARFGIPTVLYGPTGAGAHNPDEYVEVESVFTCATAFLAAALDWCGEAE
jgi:acetylornithine deacetylase